MNFYLPDENEYSNQIRENERNSSIKHLNENHAVFIESGLGFGLYEFISSLINTVKHRTIKCIKIDMSEVISKNQIDDKVKNDSGHSLCISDIHFRGEK